MAHEITFGAVQKKIDDALVRHEYDTAKNQIRYFLHNFLTYYLALNGITNVERKKSKDGNPSDYDRICALEDKQIISRRYADVLHGIRKSTNELSHIDDDIFSGKDEALVYVTLESNYKAFIAMVAILLPDYQTINFNITPSCKTESMSKTTSKIRITKVSTTTAATDTVVKSGKIKIHKK